MKRWPFQSEQAIWATRWLNAIGDESETHDILWGLIERGYTPLVEIVYPDNRIVLDYHGFEGLISLGFVDVESGEVHAPFETPDIRPTEFFGEMTLAEALARPSRVNAEGFVLQAGPYSSDFVKVKQEDYLVLHRLITGLSVKEVWRRLRAGDFHKYVLDLPDEFHAWALEKANEIMSEHVRILTDARMDVARVSPTASRKEQALWIQENVAPTRRGLVFSLLDGKDITDAIFKMIEPKGAQPLISDEA